MGADRTFTFDTVHGMDATQKEVFEDMKENLDGFIQGRNEAVLAYGQVKMDQNVSKLKEQARRGGARDNNKI